MTIATVDATIDNGVVRINISGEIDLANIAAVEQQVYTAAVSGQPAAVSMDLTNLTYMDSVGVRLLFDLASRLQQSHMTLELIAPCEAPTRRLIELSGLESVATLCPTSN